MFYYEQLHSNNCSFELALEEGDRLLTLKSVLKIFTLLSHTRSWVVWKSIKMGQSLLEEDAQDGKNRSADLHPC